MSELSNISEEKHKRHFKADEHFEVTVDRGRGRSHKEIRDTPTQVTKKERNNKERRDRD